MSYTYPVHYIFGLDLGQQRDHSALVLMEYTAAVLDRRDPVTCENLIETRLAIRLLHRYPLRTPYPMIVDQVREILHRPRLAGRSTLALDATGVGAAVHDLFLDQPLPARLCPVSITGGKSVRLDGRVWHVPRRQLLQDFQSALRGRRIAIPPGLPLARTLLKELGQIRFASFQPESARQHDDLALAAAIANFAAAQHAIHRKPQRRLPIG